MPKPNLHAILLPVTCISVSGVRAQFGPAGVDTRSAVGLVRQVAGDLTYLIGL